MALLNSNDGLSLLALLLISCSSHDLDPGEVDTSKSQGEANEAACDKEQADEEHDVTDEGCAAIVVVVSWAADANLRIHRCVGLNLNCVSSSVNVFLSSKLV